MGESCSVAYAFSMLENDSFSQTTLRYFTRTPRFRGLQLICGAMLIFAAGVLLGAWMAYQPVNITFEVPAEAPPEASKRSDTMRT